MKVLQLQSTHIIPTLKYVLKCQLSQTFFPIRNNLLFLHTNGFMKYLLAIACFIICIHTNAQKDLLTTDTTLVMPTLNFNADSELVIRASPTSSQNDFDFLQGKWKMHHRRLNKRLENCKDWTEFDSFDENHKILMGIGDIDTYTTTELPELEGKPFEGFTLRLFNPQTKLWSLYWVPSTTGILDKPVVGSFENNVGHFFAKDTYNGKPIIMVFRWDARNKNKPVWSQAFSADNGKTWEWNWYNISEYVK